jgi:hypothetical protein
LRNIIESIFEIKQTHSLPITFLSHKARNDEIDDKLANAFEEVGFFGEQV